MKFRRQKIGPSKRKNSKFNKLVGCITYREKRDKKSDKKRQRLNKSKSSTKKCSSKKKRKRLIKNSKSRVRLLLIHKRMPGKRSGLLNQTQSSRCKIRKKLRKKKILGKTR